MIKVYYDYAPPGSVGHPDNTIHTVDFNSYVKHVLPREWIPGWNMQALEAGAIAVKMYGWYNELHWRGDSHNGTCYDVDSSQSYQVWDPTYSQTATNTAVDSTWDYYLTDSSGGPYDTTYAQGNIPETCGYYYGCPAPGNTMSQYGSKACADAGRVWYDILLNAYYFSPQSSLNHGPVATASSAEGLPYLLPATNPYSNSQLTITWSGTSGVAYYLCYDAFLGPFNGTCSYLGTGVGSTFQTVPTGDGVETYYRLEACQGSYCSAIRAGGVKNRTPNGNNFYVTANYGWFYANANVGLRNDSSSSHTTQLYDGVPGFGGTVKLTCSLAPSSTCGPATWGVNPPISWYVTGTQTQGSTVDNAPVRLIPQPDGQNAGS